MGHKLNFAAETFSRSSKFMLYVETRSACDLFCKDILVDGFEKSKCTSEESECK